MNELNVEQRKAAETLEGPLLVIAGAGSGKTRVLTHRLANLLKQKKARPQEILAVTFTNKAAREMKERVERLVGLSSENLWVSTFHASCVKILRQEIEVLGYSSQFVIYDDSDQLSVIKHCYERLNWDAQSIHPSSVQAQINRAKNLGLLPEEFSKKGVTPYDEKIALLFDLYQSELKRANALDFGDLLMLTVKLFQHYENILKKYQSRFRYCMVDEYQDTNHVQYLLIKLLCQKHHNICAVGDEDQSIYSWRGADISNILSFERDFPNATLIKLEENYRSTKHIISASSVLISNNQDRKAKNLFTKNHDGEPIRVVCTEDEYQEAQFVVREIVDLSASNFKNDHQYSLNDVAIFYRTHAQSRIFEDILRQQGIPYQIFGGMRFYSRSEIKDIMAYFRLILNPKDDVSFLRIINIPTRGIGKTTIEKIMSEAEKNKVSLFETGRRFSETDPQLQKKLKPFYVLMDELISKKSELALKELYEIILDKTQYIEFLKREEKLEAQVRIENLSELATAIGEFVRHHPHTSLEQYLQVISLLTDTDTKNLEEASVKLMSLHSAKGLEFSWVFMVGLEEGLFPHAQSDWNPAEMEEERRLCYVGMTRAKAFLYLTYTNARRIRGIPQLNLSSRFLNEIPKENIFPIDVRRRVAAAVSKKKPELFDEFNQDVEEKPYWTGMRVKHASFGTGVICRVEGEEENTKITIKFDRGQVKKFMAHQTPIEKIF